MLELHQSTTDHSLNIRLESPHLKNSVSEKETIALHSLSGINTSSKVFATSTKVVSKTKLSMKIGSTSVTSIHTKTPSPSGSTATSLSSNLVIPVCTWIVSTRVICSSILVILGPWKKGNAVVVPGPLCNIESGSACPAMFTSHSISKSSGKRNCISKSCPSKGIFSKPTRWHSKVTRSLTPFLSTFAEKTIS